MGSLFAADSISPVVTPHHRRSLVSWTPNNISHAVNFGLESIRWDQGTTIRMERALFFSMTYTYGTRALLCRTLAYVNINIHINLFSRLHHSVQYRTRCYWNHCYYQRIHTHRPISTQQLSSYNTHNLF